MVEAVAHLFKLLNSPELTARFQRYAGVHYESSNRSRANGLANDAIDPGAKKRPPVAHRYFLLQKFFAFWSLIGDEAFFLLFLPPMFWNFDYWVGRRFVLTWSAATFLGQAGKDLFCWPRPASPPVIRVPDRHELEYSMPSTHAVNSCVIAFSLLLATMGRYDVSLKETTEKMYSALGTD